MPFVRPVIVIGLAVGPATVPVKLPGVDVAVYTVIVLPPFDAGAVKATLAVVLPAVANPIVGALGTPTGVTLLDANDAGPVPTELVAVTVKVYVVPFESPVTVIGLAVGPATVPVMLPGFEVAV